MNCSEQLQVEETAPVVVEESSTPADAPIIEEEKAVDSVPSDTVQEPVVEQSSDPVVDEEPAKVGSYPSCKSSLTLI